MPERMDEVQLVKILLDIPLFEGLDFSRISSIIEVCNQREIQPGEVLCEARTIDQSLIILLQGKLRLESADGKKLAEMVPVRVIGEMGVLTGQTRSSRVVGGDTAVVLELDAGDLEGLLEEDPQMANHMLVSLIKLLYRRTHDMNQEIEVLHEQVGLLRGRLEELAPDDPILAELFPEG